MDGPPRPPAPQKRLLICDDEPAVARLIARMLTAQGFEAHAETDPSRAALRLAAEAFHLVIVDLMMPGLDGIALLDRLRRVPGPSREAPAIVLTAKRLESEDRATLDRLRAKVVVKPFQVDELIDQVRASVTP